MVKYSSHEDLPKTTKYRGKIYAGHKDMQYSKKAEALKRIRDTQSFNTAKHGKVADFFTVLREYEVAGKPLYVVYWRAVYLKTPLKKRLAEIRAGHRPSDMKPAKRKPKK